MKVLQFLHYITHYLSSIFIHIHCHARVYLLTINRSVPPAPQCPLPPVSGLVTGWKPEDECLLVSGDAMDTASSASMASPHSADPQ